MADLVSQTLLNASLQNQPAWAPSLYPGLAQAASRAIRRHCNRQFTRQVFDQVFTPDPGGNLLLPEFPANEIIRLATNPTPLLTISNLDTATNQRANVRLAFTGSTDTGIVVTGLNLTRVASGVVIVNEGAGPSNPLLFSSYPTLGSVASAINGLGHGWLAGVVVSGQVDYTKWPSADILPFQSGMSCLGTKSAAYKVYVDEIDADCDLKNGIINLYGPAIEPVSSLQWGPVQGTVSDLDIQGGFLAYRVQWDAGWDIVPEEIQDATVELVKAMADRLQTDSTLLSESDGVYTWTGRNEIPFLPSAVQSVLALYSNIRA